MEDFDFIKGFAGIDLLTVDAIGKVIGRTVGVIYIGMLDAGVPVDAAQKIIMDAWGVFFATMMTQARGQED